MKQGSQTKFKMVKSIIRNTSYESKPNVFISNFIEWTRKTVSDTTLYVRQALLTSSRYVLESGQISHLIATYFRFLAKFLRAKMSISVC